MSLRTGALTLTQACSRIEQEKSGLWFTCLDDIIDKLPTSVLDSLKNPDYGSSEIFKAMDLEEQIMRTAKLRGISEDELKRTAKDFSLAPRCIRSVFKKTDPIKDKKA